MPEPGSGSISGWLVNKTTGEQLLSPEVELHRVGVPGLIDAAAVDAAGRFWFTNLAAGEYSLGAHNEPFVPQYERFVLGEGETRGDVRIELTPGGFLSGRIMDEYGRPPKRCHYTPISWGRYPDGRIGYHNPRGDFEVAADGGFTTPPLAAGRYYLRFSGILEKLPDADPAAPPGPLLQERIFDFVYPNSHDICGALGFDVASGETVSGLRIEIPRPVWHRVRGRVIGELPPTDGKWNLIVSRDFGTVNGIGGGGGPRLQPDGAFEHHLQPGRYSAEIWEFGDPKPDGRSTVLRRFAGATFTVADEDMSGVEIPLGEEILR